MRAGAFTGAPADRTTTLCVAPAGARAYFIPEHRHVGTAAQHAGRVVPEFDLTKAPLSHAAEVDRAALSALLDPLTDVQPIRRTVVIGHDQAADVERRAGDLELDAPEVVIRPLDDDHVVIPL